MNSGTKNFAVPPCLPFGETVNSSELRQAPCHDNGTSRSRLLILFNNKYFCGSAPERDFTPVPIPTHTDRRLSETRLKGGIIPSTHLNKLGILYHRKKRMSRVFLRYSRNDTSKKGRQPSSLSKCPKGFLCGYIGRINCTQILI